MAPQVNPRQIPGRWRLGYALDLHTTRSTFVGYDEFGNQQFDTVRSEVGELLYRFKYHGDRSVVAALADAAVAHARTWALPLDLLVAVPPSRQRAVQPVHVLAEAIAAGLRVPFDPALVMRTRPVPELKSVYDFDERMRLLAAAHAIAPNAVRGKRVLLFDDLYRSGATMNAVAEVLYAPGSAADVVALTITQTRSNR